MRSRYRCQPWIVIHVSFYYIAALRVMARPWPCLRRLKDNSLDG